ncbi:MAG: hypothetical protein EOO88_52010 [Pedobacter sp.]|nr:MAG: hypothetical protein EOO88_52010 [Pedobacter sp.]
MTDNQRAIAANRLAAEWAINNVSLSKDQQRVLLSNAHYFCGIHEYIDHNRGRSIQQAIKAIQIGGLRYRFLFLLAKSFIGKKFIARWQSRN